MSLHQPVSTSIKLTGLSLTGQIYLISQASNTSRKILTDLIVSDDKKEIVRHISLYNCEKDNFLEVFYFSPTKGKYGKKFQKVGGNWIMVETTEG